MELFSEDLSNYGSVCDSSLQFLTAEVPKTTPYIATTQSCSNYAVTDDTACHGQTQEIKTVAASTHA